MKNLTKVEKLKQELKLAMDIEKRNKAFNKLTKAEKRVAIAKDVIASIKAEIYIAEPMVYLAILDNDEFMFNQEIACSLTPENNCRVCAIGGLFTSKVKINNSFDSIINGSEGMREVLIGIFTKEQLTKIEVYFEGWDEYMISLNLGIKLNYTGEKFYNKYPDDKTRLLAIMQNIVKNKGTFKP